MCQISPVRLVLGSSGISAVERPAYRSCGLNITSVTAAAECVYKEKLCPPYRTCTQFSVTACNTHRANAGLMFA